MSDTAVTETYCPDSDDNKHVWEPIGTKRGTPWIYCAYCGWCMVPTGEDVSRPTAEDAERYKRLSAEGKLPRRVMTPTSESISDPKGQS